MKRSLISAIAALSICCLAVAQSAATPPTFVTTMTDTHGSTAQVITQRVGIAHSLFGRHGFDVDVRGFGGVTFKHGSMTGGLAAGPVNPWHLAKEITLNGYLFGGQTAGGKPDGGVIVTVGWNLNPSSSFQFSPTLEDRAVGLQAMFSKRF